MMSNVLILGLCIVIGYCFRKWNSSMDEEEHPIITHKNSDLQKTCQRLTRKLKQMYKLQRGILGQVMKKNILGHIGNLRKQEQNSKQLRVNMRNAKIYLKVLKDHEETYISSKINTDLTKSFKSLLKTHGTPQKAAKAMIQALSKLQRSLGFSKKDFALKGHLAIHIEALKKARGREIRSALKKTCNCRCKPHRFLRPRPAHDDNSGVSTATKSPFDTGRVDLFNPPSIPDCQRRPVPGSDLFALSAHDLANEEQTPFCNASMITTSSTDQDQYNDKFLEIIQERKTEEREYTDIEQRHELLQKSLDGAGMYTVTFVDEPNKESRTTATEIDGCNPVATDDNQDENTDVEKRTKISETKKEIINGVVDEPNKESQTTATEIDGWNSSSSNEAEETIDRESLLSLVQDLQKISDKRAKTNEKQKKIINRYKTKTEELQAQKTACTNKIQWLLEKNAQLNDTGLTTETDLKQKLQKVVEERENDRRESLKLMEQKEAEIVQYKETISEFRDQHVLGKKIQRHLEQKAQLNNTHLERDNTHLKQKLQKLLEVRENDRREILKFKRQKDAEILELKGQEDAEILELKGQNDAEILELKEQKGTEILELKEQKDVEILELKERQDAEILELKEQTDVEILELKEQKDALILANKQKIKAGIQLKRQNDAEILELKEQMDVEILELKARQDAEILELKEQKDVEILELKEQKEVQRGPEQYAQLNDERLVIQNTHLKQKLQVLKYIQLKLNEEHKSEIVKLRMEKGHFEDKLIAAENRIAALERERRLLSLPMLMVKGENEEHRDED